jgi:hypothetical protein
MSSLPLDPWVANTRKVILWLGFGWPAGIFMMGLWNSQQAAAWEIILLSLLGAFFIPPAIVLSLILPTYKSRIIAVPLILLSWELVRSPHDPVRSARGGTMAIHYHRDHPADSSVSLDRGAFSSDFF